MTELEKRLARKKYQDMLREYQAKERELQQLAIAISQQRSVAGVEEPLPFGLAETPEGG